MSALFPVASDDVRTRRRSSGGSRVLVLEEQPDLGVHIDPDHLAAARAAVAAPVLELPAGAWDPSETLATGRQAFAVIVLDGLIARTVDIGSHPGLELYAAGDLIASSTLEDCVVPAGESWTATIPTRVAILDDEFLLAARRWPRLVTGLVEQMQRQRDRLVIQLVIAEQPRVDERLLALFWLLAERFGTVGPDGVVVGLKLTHEALGRLVGAQRPTVTLALKALRSRDALTRLPDGGWLLGEQPADQVVAAAQLPVGHQPKPLTIERAAHARLVAREQRLAASTQREDARVMREESAAIKRAAQASLRGNAAR
ncbi:MAG: helix-turn-helix domain-containing protein [Solirubrobacteraceae bacterium]